MSQFKQAPLTPGSSLSESRFLSLAMADFNAMYAVVDKSKKKQKSFLPLPEDGTAESSADTSPPLYDVAREDMSTKPAPAEKAEVIDSEYSMITAEPVNPRAKKPAPENSQEYNTLQYPMQETPANRTEVFDSTYSMVALDDVHSTVNDGDLPSQQPAETDMGTSKGNSKAAAAVEQRQGTTGCKTAFICSSITIAAVVIIALIACVAFLFIKVGELEAETASLQPGELAALESSIMSQLQEISDSIERINNLNDSINQHISVSLTELKRELSEVDQIQANHTQQLNVSVEMRYEQLDLNTEQLNSTIQTNSMQLTDKITTIESKTELLINYLQIGQSQDSPLSSCADIVGLSPSGYYWVRTSSGSAVRVHQVVWWGHWRVGESGLSGQDQQQPKWHMSQWSHTAHVFHSTYM